MKESQDVSSPNSISKKVSYGIKLLRGLLHQVLKAFEDGGSTTSVVHLIYSLTVPKGKIFLVISNLIFFFNLRSAVSYPSNKHHSEKCGSIFLVTSPQCTGSCWEVPPVPPLLQAERTLGPQPLLTDSVVQSQHLGASAELPAFY